VAFQGKSRNNSAQRKRKNPKGLEDGSQSNERVDLMYKRIKVTKHLSPVTRFYDIERSKNY
jgi:hypothetical protein